MSNRSEELRDLTARFVDAFNRQDIDAVAGWFTEDAVMDDLRGEVIQGRDAIRAAFTPLVCGDRGTIRFDGDDVFVEPETNKVMASWSLTMEIEGKPMVMRGLDLLHFEGNKIAKKLVYCKAPAPRFDDA